MDFGKCLKFFGLSAALFSALTLAVKAEDAADTDFKDAKGLQTIIVTASRAPVALEESASTVTVIDSEEIADKQYRNVADALKSIPGVDVRASGGYGSTTNVRMRGLHQKYTLIMVDGVKVTDPTGMDRSANLALMTTDNVERIEVVRGNQNTLHGTSAIGGVINIITKRAEKGKPVSGSVFSEYGSNNTIRYGGTFGSAIDKANISLSVARETSDNISSADMNIDGVDERDNYRNTSFSTKIGIAPEEILSVDLTARYNSGFFEYDTGAGADRPAVDAKGECEVERDEFFGRGQVTLSLFDDRWQQIIGVNYTSIKREGSEYSVWTSDDHFYWYGEVIAVDYKNIIELNETNTLSFGAETQEEISRYGNRGWPSGVYTDDHYPKTTVRSNSYFLEDQLRFWDKWFTTLGLRVDDHDTYHQHTTWKASTSYLIEKTGTRLKTSYATGFYAPTLFNLYDTKWNGGNAGLEPERSRGWEAGFEQSFRDKRINFGAMYFANIVKNQIIWGAANRYENMNKAMSNGVEVTLSAQITDKLATTASYTYTKAKQLEPTRDLAYMPDNRASFNVNYKILANLSAYSTLNYTGSCYNGDTFWRTNDTRFQSYTIIDFGVNWDINKTFRLYGNCKNASDREYQERAGFGTFGRTFMIGLKTTF